MCKARTNERLVREDHKKRNILGDGHTIEQFVAVSKARVKLRVGRSIRILAKFENGGRKNIASRS